MKVIEYTPPEGWPAWQRLRFALICRIKELRRELIRLEREAQSYGPPEKPPEPIWATWSEAERREWLEMHEMIGHVAGLLAGGMNLHQSVLEAEKKFEALNYAGASHANLRKRYEQWHLKGGNWKTLFRAHRQKRGGR